MSDLNPANDQQLKELLEKNLAISQEVLKISKKVKRYMVVQQIFGIIYFLLIAVPIILGIIYLPNLLDQYVNRFMPQGLENQNYLQDILNQYLK